MQYESYHAWQCCGSGSGPKDPYVFGPHGSGSITVVRHTYVPGSFHHQSKIVRKTLIPTVLWPLCDFFLSLKNDVNVPSKSNNEKNLNVLNVTDENSRIQTRSGSGSGRKCHGSETLIHRHSWFYDPVGSGTCYQERIHNNPSEFGSVLYLKSRTLFIIIFYLKWPILRVGTQHRRPF